MLLPDHFRRVDQSLTFRGEPDEAWGFAGKTDFGPNKLRWLYRETVGYFVLALLLRTDSVFPFQLRGVDGNTLRFSDPNGVDVFVDLDPATSLPQSLRYDLPERTMSGEPTGRRRPTRVVLEAYAPAGRLRLPRTVKTFEGTTLMIERRFEAIEINPKLTPASFTR